MTARQLNWLDPLVQLLEHFGKLLIQHLPVASHGLHRLSQVAVHGFQQDTLSVQLRVDPVEPLVSLPEPLVYLPEPLIYLLKSLIYLLEPLVYLLEALVYLLEALVYLVEALVHLVEALVHLVKPQTHLVDLVFQPLENLLHGAAPAP